MYPFDFSHGGLRRAMQNLIFAIFAAKKSAPFLERLNDYPLLTVLALSLIMIAVGILLRPLFQAPTPSLEEPTLPKLKRKTPPKMSAPKAKKQTPKATKKEDKKTEKKASSKKDKKAPKASEKKTETPQKEEKPKAETKEKKEDKKAEKKEEKPKAEAKEEKVEKKEEKPAKDEKKEDESKVEAKDDKKEDKKAEPKEEKKAEKKPEKKEEKVEKKDDKPAEDEKKEESIIVKAPVEEEDISEEARRRRERSARLKEKRRKRLKDINVTEDDKHSESGDQPRTLQEGLNKTRQGWISKLNDLLGRKKQLTKDLLDDLEEVLYSADIGTQTTQHLLEKVEEEMDRSALKDPDQVRDTLKREIREILTFEDNYLNFEAQSPFIMMVVGVNGVGKTTTIGKVSARLRKDGKKVLLAAGDTFRAAATEQLAKWAEQTECEIVKGNDNQDPSSVIFDGIKAGVARDMDVVIADTAGRLHTQQNLMEELKKVKRVIDRAHDGAPHEVLLVVDATTGQNALNQARQFNEAIGVTGVVLTKLDGTAKGGIVVAICKELGIPIRYIGVGEHIDELRRFSPNEFTDALFG
ncbi:MAG TPA: signal recognition particle-docking protein FtsY [Myxococcales bacterium]|nr:signal recognition particle-docking protein FtsY [Deltaproteobacteria bacterium]MBU54528.1 signal recognition particle-docking protein FtsY [Deltaproteobacteria bacterium]HAA58242.1 signal recognition particle-docking protein FtsY [Myxococcales bacterium]